MTEGGTIDFDEFTKLNRFEMVDTIDAYMVTQGIPDNVRATITLLFGAVSAEQLQESGLLNLGQDLASYILQWMNDRHPEQVQELINDVRGIGIQVLDESDGS